MMALMWKSERQILASLRSPVPEVPEDDKNSDTSEMFDIPIGGSFDSDDDW